MLAMFPHGVLSVLESVLYLAVSTLPLSHPLYSLFFTTTTGYRVAFSISVSLLLFTIFTSWLYFLDAVTHT